MKIMMIIQGMKLARAKTKEASGGPQAPILSNKQLHCLQYSGGPIFWTLFTDSHELIYKIKYNDQYQYHILIDQDKFKQKQNQIKLLIWRVIRVWVLDGYRFMHPLATLAVLWQSLRSSICRTDLIRYLSQFNIRSFCILPGDLSIIRLESHIIRCFGLPLIRSNQFQHTNLLDDQQLRLLQKKLNLTL